MSTGASSTLRIWFEDLDITLVPPVVGVGPIVDDVFCIVRTLDDPFAVALEVAAVHCVTRTLDEPFAVALEVAATHCATLKCDEDFAIAKRVDGVFCVVLEKEIN